MADAKIVVKIDSRLIKDKLLEPRYRKDYQHVHHMLNTHLCQNGQILTEGRFKQGEAALRKWLFTLSKLGASQEKLTSYLRCGLAHLCFDYVESTYKMISKADLVARALVSFKNRKYHTTYFKSSPAKVKKAKAAKRKAAKKIFRRKGAKKVVKKKVIKKKAVKKAVKKVVKKKVVKKSSSKSRPAAKRPAPKRPAAKKAVKRVVKKPARKPAKKVVRGKSLFSRIKKLFK